MTETTHYYWDACVFLAYLNKEASYGIHIDHIDQFLDDAKAGHCKIYSSSITIAEITKLHLKNATYGTFNDFLSDFRSAIVPVDPNPIVMLKASHLRGMIYTKTTGVRKLATPDAIHIATALALGDTFNVPLSAFHTFDAGKGKGGADGPGLPILGYEEWCEQCSDDDMVKQVIAMKRENPAPDSKAGEMSAEKKQIDKFKEAARELETNEDEAAFDRALKRVAKAPPAGKPEAKPRS